MTNLKLYHQIVGLMFKLRDNLEKSRQLFPVTWQIQETPYPFHTMLNFSHFWAQRAKFGGTFHGKRGGQLKTSLGRRVLFETLQYGMSSQTKQKEVFCTNSKRCIFETLTTNRQIEKITHP